MPVATSAPFETPLGNRVVNLFLMIWKKAVTRRVRSKARLKKKKKEKNQFQKSQLLKKAKFITLFIFFSSQHDPHLSQAEP